MPHLLLFCQGCNRRYVRAESDSSCPVCSSSLVPDVTSGTTRLLPSSVGPVPISQEPVLVEDEAIVGAPLGPYRVERFLGRGGMARVYEARHVYLERACAIKVLSPRLADGDPEYVKLFVSEARSQAALVHPHVVTVHNIGHEKGLHFIEMELVRGETLESLVASGVPLGPVRATEILLQIASALAAAHERGVIHRDVKPSNVLVREDGVVKLADFGLAKRVHAAEASRLVAHSMVGTPHFMAPELFFGRPATHASDVYAAGVTLYYIATGHLPYVDTQLDDLARRHHEQPVPGSEAGLPEEVLGVIRRCLAKQASERYGDGRELLEALREVFGNLRDFTTLVRSAFEGLDIRWEGDAASYEIVVPITGGRTQRVFIETTTSEAFQDRIVRIFSVCAPLSRSYAIRALELNAEIPFGSIAVQEVDGIAHFVMVSTYPRATCDAEEVRKSVLEVARWADHVERILTGRDVH